MILLLIMQSLFLYMLSSSKIIRTLLALISIYVLSFPLLIELHHDFFGGIVILLYVGAISVFFTFVIMTMPIILSDGKENNKYIDKKFWDKKKNREAISSPLVGSWSTAKKPLYFIEKILIIVPFIFIYLINTFTVPPFEGLPIYLDNIELLAYGLYFYSLNEFYTLALLLLIATIGAMKFTQYRVTPRNLQDN